LLTIIDCTWPLKMRIRAPRLGALVLEVEDDLFESTSWVVWVYERAMASLDALRHKSRHLPRLPPNHLYISTPCLQTVEGRNTTVFAAMFGGPCLQTVKLDHLTDLELLTIEAPSLETLEMRRIQHTSRQAC
jgi:hypothetical protein